MSKKLKLSYKPYTLELKRVFTVATFSRSTTPIVLTEIEYDGLVGYGEASIPVYLGESQETILKFLSKINLEKYDNVFCLEDILKDVDSIEPGNFAAKASIDIALHDLIGKILNQPWYRLYGLNKYRTPLSSFTIGIDSIEMIEQKIKETEEYKILKVKLGTDNDMEIIDTIRNITDKPITVDANQGWKTKVKALEMIEWLAEKNVLFVEQPMPKEQLADIAWLKKRSHLPLIADESIRTVDDIIKVHESFDGINIKLMKCGGMRKAYQMILLARSLGLNVMLGCMTETSCGISAASQLSPMVDWADLDGALLIKNDCFEGTTVDKSKIIISDLPGIGVKKLN
jgi:L-alanine-DL-glutamate epimerase-like enolase superfamily enzyme